MDGSCVIDSAQDNMNGGRSRDVRSSNTEKEEIVEDRRRPLLDTQTTVKGTIRHFLVKTHYSKDMTDGKIGGGRLQNGLMGGRMLDSRLMEPRDPLTNDSRPIGSKKMKSKTRTKRKRGAKSSTVGGIGSQGMKTDSSQPSIVN